MKVGTGPQKKPRRVAKEAPPEVNEGPAKDVEEGLSETILARNGDDLAGFEEEDRTAE